MALLTKVNHLWASTRSIYLKNSLILRQTQNYSNLAYRVKASTLMETLVATVLIVIIFMISSMLLNNILAGNIRQNTEVVQERLNTLEYQYKNNDLKLPYSEDFDSWEITILIEENKGVSLVMLEAENPKTKKKLINYISDAN